MVVTEIFESIQGETTQAGRLCSFVRFTGCDLRCRYCDSAYAYEGGTRMTGEEIVGALKRFRARFTTLTGGEPMLQREVPLLCAELLGQGFEVAVETHGQAPLGDLPRGVRRIIDVKTPGSGEEDRAFINLGDLKLGDEIKFVVTSKADFRWSADVIRRFSLEGKVPLLLSPAPGAVEPADLVRWMLADGVGARLNLQLHKVIWGPNARGV
jgi:7-carboxy-7-deazaguanine synthase